MKALRMFAVAAAVVIAGMSASAAYADIIPTLMSVTPIGGGEYAWTYNVNIDAFEYINTTANPGYSDFITIYDFNGLEPGSATFTVNPSLLSLSSSVGSQLLGPNGFLTNPPDNPSVPNVFVDFTGNAPTDTLLGTLTIDSTVNGEVVGAFSGQATLNSGNFEAGNNGSTLVPTPEPGTLALLGSGLLGLVGFARRRVTVRKGSPA